MVLFQQYGAIRFFVILVVVFFYKNYYVVMVNCYYYKYSYCYYCSPGNFFGIVIWRPAGQRHHMTMEEINPSLYSECDQSVQELRGRNSRSGIFFFTLKQTKLPTRLPQYNVQ